MQLKIFSVYPLVVSLEARAKLKYLTPEIEGSTTRCVLIEVSNLRGTVFNCRLYRKRISELEKDIKIFTIDDYKFAIKLDQLQIMQSAGRSVIDYSDDRSFYLV